MKYKLDELFDLQMGKTPSRSNLEYWNTRDNKWISIADLSKCEKYIVDTKEYISDLAVKESGISQIPSNTVIMSFKLSIGKTAITKEPIYSNEAIMSFRDKKVTQIIPDYIYYLILSKDWNESTNKAVMGKTLNKATLSKITINIHNITEQEQIVSVLDKVGSVISKRKQQLEKLDELVKARFVEMFGDPMNNSKDYTLSTFGNLFELNAGGTPSKQKKEYWENGNISWIGSNLCQNNIITENDGKYITQAGYDNSSARLFPINTVLIALVGATIGKTALIKFETTTNQNVLGIRNIEESNNNPYFVFYYTQGLHQKFMEIGDGGFSMASKSFVSKLPFPMVDIDLQNQFAAFVEQVNKSKSEVKQALEKLETLKKALMQKYFG